MSANLKKVLSEEQLIDKMLEELYSCDGDMLAQIAGIMFGGKCYAIDDKYEFTPNENYYGTFDGIR